MLVVAFGCEAGANGVSDVTHQTSEVAATACTPLKVVFFQDVSGSGGFNRTPRLTVGDLGEVLDHLVTCGGEIAIGHIGSTSNHPLLRLRLARPPVTPPVEATLRGTSFERRRARAEHAALMEQYQAAAAEHLRQAEGRVTSFLQDAEELLAAPATQPWTDVWGSIARASLYLNEPEATGESTRKVTILISDATHDQGRNAGESPRSLPANTALYLVNGEPSLGSLADLNPVQFESIASAIHHLLRENAR